jgi:hypothetical protein
VDFDGSVQSTRRHAEGTAVGYNKKKGTHSYYPLFCTIGQTGQVFDVHHRPRQRARLQWREAFMTQCLEEIQATLPGVKLEICIDSAFFSEDSRRGAEGGTGRIHDHGTVRAPRSAQGIIDRRRLDGELSYFEASWKPKSWS